MFKASLIHDQSYYKERRILFFLSATMLVIFVIVFVVGILPFWSKYFLVLLIALILIVEMKFQKSVNKKKDRFFLHLDLNKIEIVDRDNVVIEQFHPERIEKIELKIQFRLLGESITEAVSELKGKTYMQRLDVVEKGKKYTYFFEINSHYMIVQLRKIVDHWKTQQVNFDMIES